MEKNTTPKQRKRFTQKDMSFDEALRLLKRKHRVAREQWSGGLHLVIVENDKGDKVIAEKNSTSTQLIPHHFDQVELLANDWCKI